MPLLQAGSPLLPVQKGVQEEILVRVERRVRGRGRCRCRLDCGRSLCSFRLLCFRCCPRCSSRPREGILFLHDQGIPGHRCVPPDLPETGHVDLHTVQHGFPRSLPGRHFRRFCCGSRTFFPLLRVFPHKISDHPLHLRGDTAVLQRSSQMELLSCLALHLAADIAEQFFILPVLPVHLQHPDPVPAPEDLDRGNGIIIGSVIPVVMEHRRPEHPVSPDCSPSEPELLKGLPAPVFKTPRQPVKRTGKEECRLRRIFFHQSRFPEIKSGNIRHGPEEFLRICALREPDPLPRLRRRS